MDDKKIYIGEYTSFAMEGLVMDDHEKQLYKIATDLYMTTHDRAVENGADEDEAHKIATNILVANYRSDD